MSSLYIGLKFRQSSEKIAQLLKFTQTTKTEQLSWNQITGVVTRVDDMNIWGSATDPKTGIGVALGGRIALEKADWEQAKQLPYQGGLACQRIISAWLEYGNGIEQWLNGAFCVVIFEPRRHELHVITDRMGIFPLYMAKTPELRLCSHPDVLADTLQDEGIKTEIDWTTLAEFLATGNSVHPYTYYNNIQQLDAGTHYTWNLNDASQSVTFQEYWQPAYMTQQPNEQTTHLDEELAQAIKSAVRRRSHTFLGKTGVFLSGGADSRSLLFSAEKPNEVECITFFDEPNAELNTAHQLTKAAQATHHQWQRQFESYGQISNENIRISGGMWSIIDGHYLGFLKDFQKLKLGTVLTGCYADYMFKGLAFNRQHKTLFNRALPLYQFSPSFQYEFYSPHYSLSEKWQNKVNARLQERFNECTVGQPLKNPLILEEKRLRPISREADTCGRLVLWRTMPWDWVYSDSEVLDVYGRLPVSAKVNSIIFERAVAKITGKTGKKILNNNYGNRMGASETERVAWFLFGVLKRKINRFWNKKTIKESIVTTGSWPDWSYYLAHSEVIKELWGNPTSSEREFFMDVLGEDPWETSVQFWANKNPLVFCRLLTVHLWMRQRNLI